MPLRNAETLKGRIDDLDTENEAVLEHLLDYHHEMRAEERREWLAVHQLLTHESFRLTRLWLDLRLERTGYAV